MSIQVLGATENNLQDIDVTFSNGLTVVTGVSGSGKTSLVFDTLYHEAHRRFLDIFTLGSAKASIPPARVRKITGLGPAVAVGQNLLNRNPASNLASASGLHPFFRLLYARFGGRHCPVCGHALAVLTADEIIENMLIAANRGPLDVFAPLVTGVKGSHRTLLSFLKEQVLPGDLWIDGAVWDGHHLDPARPHDIIIRVASTTQRISSLTARKIFNQVGNFGTTKLEYRSPAGPRFESHAQAFAPVCSLCGAWFGDLKPVHFHTPCPFCGGAASTETPPSPSVCPHCHGTGLHPIAAAVTWAGFHFSELLALPVDEAAALFARSPLLPSAARLQTEIVRRLDALQTAGLGYIALNRSAPTLSRGEAQRVRLSVIMVSRLEDMLHILDEPTIGLHPNDVARLLPAFRRLAGPVIFVEHDRMAAASADQVIDLGPGAGKAGGQVVFSGPPADLWRSETPTGRYFSQRAKVKLPLHRPIPVNFLTIRGAYLRNLQNIDVPVPLGRLTVVTGVSGSGKSTLVEDVLFASLISLSQKDPAERKLMGCLAMEGPRLKPVIVDQSPIGRNPRSNPATYTNLADPVRDAFANATGLSPSHFSFNRPEGACPVCDGMGAQEVRMRYLPSTWITCPACDGQRFSDEVLAIRASFKNHTLTIADFFKLSVEETLALIETSDLFPPANRRVAIQILQALVDLGLGYLQLGQPSPTLSGGEAQRVKLARYLGQSNLPNHLLILDEPSTGLHPQDVNGLLQVFDRLVHSGATIVLVEHNPDLIRAADWVIDLGPGAGPAGGKLVFAGPSQNLLEAPGSLTARALLAEAVLKPGPPEPYSAKKVSGEIIIHNARANNLKGIDVAFRKGAFTVVTGVSGSGKSSLVGDVLEVESRRRFLESLSMYERQGIHEGAEAQVDSIQGLGVALTISPERRMYERRATAGTATELSHHLANLLAAFGKRACPRCAETQPIVMLERQTNKHWLCPACGYTAPLPHPRHFNPTNYAAACQTCHGIGTLQVPCPDKLIIHPEKPLTAGAMYSPGFFPKGFLGKKYNSGYDLVQALAARYGFDPQRTPWNQMPAEAQHAFLYGDPKPIQVNFHSRTGREQSRSSIFPGFYGWIRDWDVGGTYTRTEPCPNCAGSGLRPDYAGVTLGGLNSDQMQQMPLDELYHHLTRVVAPEIVAPEVVSSEEVSTEVASPEFLSDEFNSYEWNSSEMALNPRKEPGKGQHPAALSLFTTVRRLSFLIKVGLGYINLNRVAATLSAGEAQRIRLTGLLGSGLTGLTLLLDEPTRGLHPVEVDALLATLLALRDEGNTLIVVEHDLAFIRKADTIIDLGPGSGAAGGKILANGPPEQLAASQSITAAWLKGERQLVLPASRREPAAWLTLSGARANNLKNETIRFPLGVLLGICGVSGSGKSSLVLDTLGRALAPRKQTTSVAYAPVEPGEHDAIAGAPKRALVIDQSRAGLESPASFLELERPLRRLFASSPEAAALGLSDNALTRGCSACGGGGILRTDMGFLPDITSPCETCLGTGLLPEAWEVHLHGWSLPEVYRLTVDEVFEIFGSESSLRPALEAARAVGLGYLVLHQPGSSLSGGEAQRLKIAAELCQKAPSGSLYILDEPTVGQHLEDIARLIGVLDRLVAAGHSVWVVEHHPHLLAACDWLIEMGPGGGPAGGSVIASDSPILLARGRTPIAPYLRAVLANR